MNLDETTYNLIDQYLLGKLPKEHPFVERLAVDSELRLEVEMQKSIAEAVQDYRLLSVEKTLESRRGAFVKQNSKNWYWLFLSIPVILTTAAYFYFSSSTVEMPKESVIVAEKDTLAIYPDKVENKRIVNSGKVNTKFPKLPVAKEIVTTKVEDLKAISISDSIIDTKTENLPEQVENKKPDIPSKPIHAVANPCQGLHFNAFIEETRPCYGNADGKLKIRDAKGGVSPYQFSLDGNHFQFENLFESLKEAEYTAWVKDANGCEGTVYQKFSLKSKNCVASGEYVFNPQVNPLEIVTSQEKKGVVSIVDVNGERVYSQIFERSEKLIWTGNRNGGTMLLPGLYIYTINYSDGALEQGRITIAY